MLDHPIENRAVNVIHEEPASRGLQRFKAICAGNDNGIMQFKKFKLNEDHLIVFCEPEVGTVFAINLASTARFPVAIDYDELIKLIDVGEVLVVEYNFDDKTFIPEEDLNDSVRKRMNERYQAILPLIIDLDNSLKNGYGSGAFAKAAQDAKKGVRYIYDTFYSFLRHGCRKIGLSMPQGKDANYAAEPRKIRVKQGRPGDSAEGKVLEEYDFKAFEWAEKKYQNTSDLTIQKSFEDMINEFYRTSRELLSITDQRRQGKKFKINLKEDWERPTANQFYFWLQKRHDGKLARRDKGKQNAVEFASDIAGRSGNAGL